MVHRFRGEGIHKVDGKGRVSIPALFRRVLESADPDWRESRNPNLVIVYGGLSQEYLEVYTQTAIDEVDQKISRLPRGSKERRALEHIFNGQSFATQTDDTGRLVLPNRLRDKVGILNEAHFKATGDTFRISSPQISYRHESAIESWLDSKGLDFDPLTLLDSPLTEEKFE
ncbi:MAG: MraZ protein [Paracoccaceae bacterium]